jgi:hypothetical protein
MKRYLTTAALFGALALTAFGSSAVQAQPARSECFYSNQWGNWKATDDHTMYIRVNQHEIFRLDFANSCTEMTWPGAHLITHVHGSDSICSPLDIDLKVSTDRGFATPCIVSGMTRLSDAQVAALPKSALP